MKEIPKYYLRLGALDPMFRNTVIPDTLENFFKGYCDSKSIIIVAYLFLKYQDIMTVSIILHHSVLGIFREIFD